MNSLKLTVQAPTATLDFEVFGGPFRDKPNNFFGICLLEEPPLGRPFVELWLPIPDFSIPDDDQEVTHALKRALGWLLDGKRVYVGCMGGRGRTGLFLALLVKAATRHNSGNAAVGYVREKFSRHAVETSEQEDYVEAFDVSGLRFWLAWQVFKRQFTKLFPWL